MWDRRHLIASMAAISATAAASGNAEAQLAGAAMPSMPGMIGATMTAEACIESCWRCHMTCLQTERHCLEKGGAHVTAAHLALMADCAALCVTTADSMLRRSSQHAAVCTACAQVCDACAQECEAFKDDERMLACARSCTECAGHCREMSKLPI